MPKSKFKIKDKEPGKWTYSTSVILKIFYAKIEDTYIFLYKIKNAVAATGDPIAPLIGHEGAFLAGKIVPDEKGGFRFDPKYIQALDIGIVKDQGDVLVFVETVDYGEFKDLFWYQGDMDGTHVDAVMTEEDQTDYYGHLFYSDDGMIWGKNIPSDKCRYIQFKAVENKDDPEEHKFSYNVTIPYLGNQVPIEIDPEIQNPKLD